MGRVLVIGQGGREHALCWRLHEEGHDVHVAPGNAGMAEHGTLHAVPTSVDAFDELVALAQRLHPDFAVVGPEQPLVDGLADRLRRGGVATVGPSAAAAELEASKSAAKEFMARHRIPTAKAITVDDLATGMDALGQFSSAPVVKADGLAAGKGVTVCDSFAEAEAALRECLRDRRFGEAGTKVVLEERLQGQEVSLFVLSDGDAAMVFAPAQDHKRIGEGDTGPNTGGMGAYVPAPIFDEGVRALAMETIVEPTLAGLRAEGRPFVGVLFVGLMVDLYGRPMVIEYNVRFGDPEAQPLMYGLQTSAFEALHAAATHRLESGVLPGMPSATVVLASAGYPASSHRGDVILGLEDVASLADVQVFHAGTRRNADGAFETAGGRVLGICGRGPSLDEALTRAYMAVDRIRFDGMQVRRDIGLRVRSPDGSGI